MCKLILRSFYIKEIPIQWKTCRKVPWKTEAGEFTSIIDKLEKSLAFLVPLEERQCDFYERKPSGLENLLRLLSMSVHKGRLMNLHWLKKKKTWTKFYTNNYLKTSKHYEFVDLSREDRHGERTKGKDK